MTLSLVLSNMLTQKSAGITSLALKQRSNQFAKNGAPPSIRCPLRTIDRGDAASPLAPHQWIGIIAAVTRSKAPMKFAVLTALVAATLSGCATSVARLGEDDIDVSISSTFPAQQVAGCLALWLQGANPTVTLSPDHYVISRANGYGFPVVRWDIKTTPTGSVIEGRTRLNINNGTGKARSCAVNPSPASR